MVPKELGFFSKQFRIRVKAERKREKMDSHKNIWSSNIFLLSRNIHPFFMRLLELFSFSLFFQYFFSSSISLFSEWLMDFGDIWGENKLQIFFGWDESGYTMNMKVVELLVYRR
jgi:hypothetical protein